MKWINNALLCCVLRGSLDYELSAEQEAQQWGVRFETPPLQREAEKMEEAFGARIRMSDKMPRGLTNMFHSHILSRHIHTCSIYTQKKCHMQQGRVHTHSRAAKGQGTYCHTHCLKCHTQASLGVWRAEGSCQARGRFVPTDTACLIC